MEPGDPIGFGTARGKRICPEHAGNLPGVAPGLRDGPDGRVHTGPGSDGADPRRIVDLKADASRRTVPPAGSDEQTQSDQTVRIHAGGFDRQRPVPAGSMVLSGEQRCVRPPGHVQSVKPASRRSQCALSLVLCRLAAGSTRSARSRTVGRQTGKNRAECTPDDRTQSPDAGGTAESGRGTGDRDGAGRKAECQIAIAGHYRGRRGTRCRGRKTLSAIYRKRTR